MALLTNPRMAFLVTVQGCQAIWPLGRHSGLEPESKRATSKKFFWIPAFAGMTGNRANEG
jgi:hypothetical protein